MPLTLNEEEELELELEIANAKAAAEKENFGNEVAAKAPQPEGTPYMENYEQYRPNTLDPSGLVPLGKGVLKGIANVGSEVVKTGVAAAESFNRYMQPERFEGTPSATQVVEEALPRIEPEPDSFEQFAVPATEIGMATAGGIKTGIQVAKQLPKAKGWIGKGLAGLTGAGTGEVTFTAMLDKDTDPLIFSQPQTEGDDPATARMKKTAILAQDAITTGLLAGAAGKGVAAATGYGFGVVKKAFNNWRNLDTIQQDFVKTIMDRVAKIPEGASAAEHQQAYQDVIDYINQNAEVVTSFGRPDISDIVENEDTITTLLSRLDPKDKNDMIIKNELEALRASALGGNQSPRLQSTLEAPERNLKSKLGELEEVSGGSAATAQTQDAVIDQGQMDIAAARVPEYEVGEELAQVNRQTEDVLRQDPSFGPQLQKIEEKKTLGLDPAEAARDTQTKAVEAVKDADLAADAATNAAYKKVADSGAPADMASWKAAREQVEEIIPTHLRRVMDAAEETGSFGDLHTKVLPQLTKYINTIKQARPDDFHRLLELKNNITRDQMDYIRSSNVDEFGYANQTARDVDAAKASHAKEQDVWNTGGLTEDMRRNRLDNPPFDPNRPHKREGFIEKGRETLMSAIKDPNRRESVQQLRQAIGIKNAHLIDDVVVAEAARDTLNELALKAGKISDVEWEKLARPMQDMIAGVSQKNKSRLEKMFTDVRDGKLKGDELKLQLDELKKQGDAAEAKIYEDYLGDFLKKNGEKVDNPSAIFKGIFTGEKNASKLDNIISVASADPVAKKGIEAAWAKQAQNLLKNQKDVPEFPEHFIQYGRQIFKDTPEVVDAFQNLNARARKISNENKVRMGGGLGYNENQTQHVQGVNQLITWLFGVLNPTAARIRTITSDISKQNNSGDIARQAGDIILANAKDFSAMAQKIVNEQKGKMTPADKKLAYKWLVKAGIYGDGDEQRVLNDTDAQTDQAFDIDISRPIIENDDGSFSTERTATRQDENGKWVVFPTIVNGKQLSEEAAWRAIKAGKNKAVGSFDSLDESEAWAVERSKAIGKKREGDRIPR